MKNYKYQNTLISKKQLKQLLSWSFTKYGSIKACFLADQLKNLGFKYATQAGISISIEDLRVPYIKSSMLQIANQEILNSEKVCLKGKITDVERFQKIIDTWNITSESLKDEVVSYFKKYDPLNSIYIMAFSGARGNLSQVRQLVGMRGLMSDPSGEIMNLPIKKNFREGLTITDYLMSGYGARKGIVDTALKTANSGYLTRRLIDVAQDIIIREKDCLTNYAFLIKNIEHITNSSIILGRLLNKTIYNKITGKLISNKNTQITPTLIHLLKEEKVPEFYIRSPLTCDLYRSICQKCYGWDLATENLVDMGEAVGIIAGQSIGEPGTQLTMRTFHTGGIFTSKANQQLISPISGTIEFSEILKVSKLRTNRGENVSLTDSSGTLSVIEQGNSKIKKQIELPRNTILFVKNKQFIKKDTVIGQLTSNTKQTRTETKHILSDVSGEIFIPKLQNKINSTTQNKLLWILEGQVYQAPLESFLNFYSDHKIDKHSFIFRSKLINQQAGFIKLLDTKNNKFQKIIQIVDNKYFLSKTTIEKLSEIVESKNYLIIIKNIKYLITLSLEGSQLFLPKLCYKNFGTLVTNNFRITTGGIPFYSYKLKQKRDIFNNKSSYFINTLAQKYSRTLIWISEEICDVECNDKLLLIKNKSFISKDREIFTNSFSNRSGIFSLLEKNLTIQQFSIKPGIVYKIGNLKSLNNQIFYPGEIILDLIKIDKLCLCEVIKTGSNYLLLIRFLTLFEIPQEKHIQYLTGSPAKQNLKSISILTTNIKYPNLSGKKIVGSQNYQIIKVSLNLDPQFQSSLKKADQSKTELIINKKKNSINFIRSKKLSLINYVPAELKYVEVQFCLIVENNQFVDSQTTIGYFETVSSKSLELVKLKMKQTQNKQIFLISNDDCVKVNKETIKNKTINKLLIDDINIYQTGKTLINHKQFLTIQKGRPYFFPKCRNNEFIEQNNLKYRLIKNEKISQVSFNRYKKINVNINYYDITNRIPNSISHTNNYEKVVFPKMILKKRGNYYTSGIPIFVREFIIKAKNQQKTILSNLQQTPWNGYLDYKDKIYKTKRRDILSYAKRIRFENIFIMFMKNSEFVSRKTSSSVNYNIELASVFLLEHPFKTIGIHSVTEDYFEQEVNSVYCKNGEFIEQGQTIGLLNSEKEITGDIVQGLPRIEELLEARKKKRVSKHTPKSQKKSLLIRKTTIDPNFEFRKLGSLIKENDKINPHSLLKIYFNYYAKIKYLIFNKTDSLKLHQLSNNYEASYRSFKKIQALILNSVQSVYQSQGVTIDNKHLEIIIKQMTTKVLITHEGDTPLLPREVIDLYHIKYINKVVQTQKKSKAYYVPLLLGITKAALNNPSFISAASFQETTRILTKAAIEGKIDWLRGLKENIIIGHLIPAGTGFKNHINLF